VFLQQLLFSRFDLRNLGDYGFVSYVEEKRFDLVLDTKTLAIWIPIFP
jgi:hypothetical protein